MANYSVDYLQRLYSAVRDFQRAFEAWLETQVESDHMSSRGIYPTVWPKDGVDTATVRGLELDVAEAAGSASRAVSITGCYMVVQGVGPIDPIANWSMMANPKALLSPDDVRTVTATVLGRLSALIGDAEAAVGSDVPAFSPASMHPVVWAGAAVHWTSHQYRVAVREAAEALVVHWKERLGRNDVDDTPFWQQTLSAGPAEPGRPKLRWPGDAEDKTTKSMRGGLEPLAKSLNGLATGLNLTIRNVATHTRVDFTEQEAMERLAAYSYLARLLDQCEIDRVESGDAL